MDGAIKIAATVDLESFVLSYTFRIKSRNEPISYENYLIYKKRGKPVEDSPMLHYVVRGAYRVRV